MATPDPPRVSLLHPHVDKYEDPASLDTLDFGLVACRELVPDLDDLLTAIIDDIAGLAKAAGV